MKYTFNYRYKYYEHSPKATKYSDFVGRAFSWPCYLAYVVLFYGLVSRRLFANFLNINVTLSAVVTIALTVAFVFLLKQLRKIIDKKIDEFAEKEKNGNI